MDETVECIEELWMDLTRQEGEYFLGMNLEEEDLFLSFLIAAIFARRRRIF